jgi:hypothetical protein
MRRTLFLSATLLTFSATTGVAFAQERLDGHVDPETLYPLEVEPHFAFGAENVYGTTGFGAGVRLGIPVVAGHIGRLPQNVAVSFGADWLHYDNCYFGSYCGADYLMLPAAAQWNIFLSHRVSVFGELGFFVYKGWFSGCGPDDGPGCSAPSDFGLLPTIAIGGRLHVTRNLSVALRLGYPTSTLGVSFL